MKHYLHRGIYLIFLAASASIFGQNIYDSMGKKTGYWIVTFPNGNTRYESEFQSGKPVGMMKRYDENGRLSAEMMFDTIEDRCYAKLYNDNRKLAAEGWYVNQVKDSVWTYYSEYDDHVILREPYENGMINGIAESYYPNGQVSEQTHWMNNRKDGQWTLFFEDGGIRSKGNFSGGSREGDYLTYYSDSTLELSGQYKNNVADGNWVLYDENGTLKFTFKYSDGKLLNESELLKSDDDVLNKLQEIPDPGIIEEQ